MKTPHFWRSRNFISTLLLPFSALYAIGFAFDKLASRKQSAPLPILAVGNVTAGGAGKTPTTIALVALLRSMGHTPHIVTRGYGGRVQGVHRVEPTDIAADIGDEAVLLARHAPTWVSPHRIEAAASAHKTGATVLVADDAMQHHALAHDLCVLVVDLNYGIGNGRLLPAGPLRQSLASAYGKTPIIAVAIGEDDPHRLLPLLAARGPLVRATLLPTSDAAWLRENKWLAFAGIAHPQKFYATLKAHGAEIVDTVDFADHHHFTRGELEQMANHAAALGAKLITTEKDAVRIPGTWNIPVATLPVTLRIPQPEPLQNALGLIFEHDRAR